MFRNLASLLLYIGILFFNVKLPNWLLISYTFFMFLGDGYNYFPKNVQKQIAPTAFFFERNGPIYYNIEFLPIVILSIYIFIKTLYIIIETRSIFENTPHSNQKKLSDEQLELKINLYDNIPIDETISINEIKDHT